MLLNHARPNQYLLGCVFKKFCPHQWSIFPLQNWGNCGFGSSSKFTTPPWMWWWTVWYNIWHIYNKYIHINTAYLYIYIYVFSTNPIVHNCYLLPLCNRSVALLVPSEDGGCNHMTCAFCGADFCWLCGRHLTGPPWAWLLPEFCPDFAKDGNF